MQKTKFLNFGVELAKQLSENKRRQLSELESEKSSTKTHFGPEDPDGKFFVERKKT